MSLAYTYVAIAVMLAEVNRVGPRLELPDTFPLVESDLRKTLVFPPSIVNRKHPGAPNFGGRLNTDRYGYSFSDDGRLCYVTLLNAWMGMNNVERNNMLVSQKAIIDTNVAYTLATNWLEQVSVDVRSLTNNGPIVVHQKFFWKDNDDHSKGKNLLPLFDITWGGKESPDYVELPIVDIEIDGRTKEMISLRLEDDFVSHQPAPLITNLNELLKISDEEFSSYTIEEKKKLVSKFSALTDNGTKK